MVFIGLTVCSRSELSLETVSVFESLKNQEIPVWLLSSEVRGLTNCLSNKLGVTSCSMPL